MPYVFYYNINDDETIKIDIDILVLITEGNMLIFDIADSLLFNIGINIFASIVTLMVIITYKRNFTDTYDVLLMIKINTLILVCLFTDTIMWILNGRSGTLFRILSYGNLIIYFLVQIAITLEWLRYAYYGIYEKNIYYWIRRLLLGRTVAFKGSSSRLNSLH